MVGAGPAGMVLSLLLSRSGIRVVVLEQATTFAREFRGELLQPGVMRIFDDIGLRERVLSLGNEFPTGVSAQIERRLLTFEFPGVPDAEGLGGITIAPQRELLEMLAEEAVKRPEFSADHGMLRSRVDLGERSRRRRAWASARR